MHPRKDPSRRCLKPHQWPAIDLELWQAARQKGDILEGGGPAANWAAHTVLKIQKGYGRWLTWFSANGYLAFSAPAERVTRANVAAYVASLQALNAPYTVLTRVQELYQAMSAMLPEEDWTWIRRIESRLRRTATPARPKRSRLVPTSELGAFGMELMAAADGPAGGTPLQNAVGYRDGLMIALLAARPLRRRNFSALEIGRHLEKRGEAYWLCIPSEETKTHEPFEAPIPNELVQPLERYLAIHRPLLIQRKGRWNRADASRPAVDALWISKGGSAMTEIAIHFRIVTLTRARYGRSLSMHLFRDCLATSIAIEDPAHVHITKSGLGHSTLRTSERHYNHASSLQASRRYQAEIIKLRRKLRRSARTDPNETSFPRR